MKLFEQNQAGYADSDFQVSVWFERDRQNIRLQTPRGRVVFDLWDEAVTDAVESGYLKRPRHPRQSEKEWLPCALNYARGIGLLPNRPSRRVGSVAALKEFMRKREKLLHAREERSNATN